MSSSHICLSLKLSGVNNTLATIELKTDVKLHEENIDTKLLAKELYEELKQTLTEESLYDMLKSYNYKNASFIHDLGKNLYF